MSMKELSENLVSWIMEKVLSAGCRGTVLGMSGGIDSSVVAVLCQQAFPQNTLGILNPCHSISEDEEHALAIAKKFSIETRKVVLDSVFDTMSGIMQNNKTDATASRLSEANLKARLRMITWYYFANQLNYMVVGSSNRSEITVGYFTKYGDGGVDIMPLGNLVKSQVRELADFLGIPKVIIDKAPSAGLWPGQTDEADMGFSYDELDRYLLTGQVSDEVKNKIESMKAHNQHKRSLPPIADFKV
jgi:NAD+ synthase